jgi:antitoxin (DNA-binding transcriptional repressor) of toxin-antitoxin stability system
MREDQEVFIVTYRGRPIARLIPEEPTDPSKLEFEQTWAELHQLAMELGRQWPKGLSAAQAVSDDRREL